MSERALQQRLPGSPVVTKHLLQGLVVGATLAVLGTEPVDAAGTAGLFVVLTVAIDGAAVVVGDYADNVLLGLLTLVFAGFLAPADVRLPILAIGLPVGGWLVFDGVQHLWHGETRDEGGLYRYDGGILWVLLQALFARLVEPFRL